MPFRRKTLAQRGNSTLKVEGRGVALQVVGASRGVSDRCPVSAWGEGHTPGCSHHRRRRDRAAGPNATRTCLPPPPPPPPAPERAVTQVPTSPRHRICTPGPGTWSGPFVWREATRGGAWGGQRGERVQAPDGEEEGRGKGGRRTASWDGGSPGSGHQARGEAGGDFLRKTGPVLGLPGFLQMTAAGHAQLGVKNSQVGGGAGQQPEPRGRQPARRPAGAAACGTVGPAATLAAWGLMKGNCRYGAANQKGHGKR